MLFENAHDDVVHYLFCLQYSLSLKEWVKNDLMILKSNKLLNVPIVTCLNQRRNNFLRISV